MSNKKKSKTKTLTVGAFVFTKSDECIRVRTASDNFKAEWRTNSPIYAFISRLWDDNYLDLLHTYIAMCYQACNMIPDIGMLKDWVALVQNWTNRFVRDLPELDEGEMTELRYALRLQDDARDPAKLEKMFNDAQEELADAQRKYNLLQKEE